MRFLLAAALLATPLAGCARAVPTARPMAAPAAYTAAGTVELRRAVRAHAEIAFGWADVDADGILVMGEAERLGIDRPAFIGKDRDGNGALNLLELLGATHVSDEVRRLRDLTTVLLGDAPALDRAAWQAAPLAVRPLAYTPSPDPGAKAALFAPSDANADGKLERREIEAALGLGLERGYEVVGASR